MKTKFLSIFAAIIIMLSSVPEAYSASEAEKAAEAIKAQKEDMPMKYDVLNKNIEHDTVFGEDSAPVRVVEYASLSCSHCMLFHKQVFPFLDKEYIKTGKVQFVYRHFPLNLSALRGAMLLECVEDDARKKLFLSALFKTQKEWAFVGSEDKLKENLLTVGKIGGIGANKIDSCLNDKAVEGKILANQLEVSKRLNISSTPTVFVNGQKYTGVKSYDELSKSIDAELKRAGKLEEDKEAKKPVEESKTDKKNVENSEKDK